MSSTKSIWRSPIVRSNLERGPLGGGHQKGLSSLSLADSTGQSALLIKSSRAGSVGDALGVSHGESTRANADLILSGTAPGEWLALGTEEATQSIVSQSLSADASALVLDVTHGIALFRLSGSRAGDLLAKLCAIDFHESAFPNASVRVTSVARVDCALIRDDQEGSVSFLIRCNRSLGQYLWDQFLDAGIEFELTPSDPEAS